MIQGDEIQDLESEVERLKKENLKLKIQSFRLQRIFYIAGKVAFNWDDFTNDKQPEQILRDHFESMGIGNRDQYNDYIDYLNDFSLAEHDKQVILKMLDSKLVWKYGFENGELCEMKDGPYAGIGRIKIYANSLTEGK